MASVRYDFLEGWGYILILWDDCWGAFVISKCEVFKNPKPKEEPKPVIPLNPPPPPPPPTIRVIDSSKITIKGKQKGKGQQEVPELVVNNALLEEHLNKLRDHKRERTPEVGTPIKSQQQILHEQMENKIQSRRHYLTPSPRDDHSPFGTPVKSSEKPGRKLDFEE